MDMSLDFQFNDPGGNDPDFFKGTTLWTVACSTLGGVYKAQASPMLMLDALNLDGSIAVMSYAFMSAVIGYCTKKGLDFVFKKFKRNQ